MTLLALALTAPAMASAQAPAQPAPKEKAQTPPVPRSEGRASGSEDGNPYTERFTELDRDKNDFVSRDEWPLEPESFNVVDRDKDGRLSRHELLTPNVLREGQLERRFSWLDTNRDGFLDSRELQRGGLDLQRLDRNKDGTIARGEIRNPMATIENTWKPGASPRAQSQFRTLDRNRDNRVGRIEWKGAKDTFHRLDRNRDGVLSPYEWPGR
jgi:Ca2+-binding EF-hand superfamily protein